VLNDRAWQRIKVGKILAACNFLEFLVKISVLVFVAREEHASCKAATVVQLEKISAVDGNGRTFVIKIRSGEDCVSYIECRILVVGSLDGSFAQDLRIFFEQIALGVDGSNRGFVRLGCRFLREIVWLTFLLPGFEQLQPRCLQFLKLLSLGLFLSNIEVSPVHDVSRIADGLNLRAEIADPEAVMRDNFDADPIALQQLAYLKFLTSLLDGTLGRFVGSQQQDWAEFSGLADNIHLNLKQVLLFDELGVVIPQQSCSYMTAVFDTSIQRLERQHDNVSRGVLCGSGHGLCARTGRGTEEKQEKERKEGWARAITTLDHAAFPSSEISYSENQSQRKEMRPRESIPATSPFIPPSPALSS
jgi:hypothetical protein